MSKAPESGITPTTTNPRLADELEAIRSIYGESTVTITSSCERSTAVSLKLLDLDYLFTFSFPAAYPDEPPDVNGVDPLYMGILPKPKKRLRILKSYLDQVYTPGKECLFDLLSGSSQALPISEHASKVVTSLDLGAPEFQQIPHLVDVAELLKKATCAACMDELLVVDMARVPCHHFYCSDCLQSKHEPEVASNS